MKRDRPLHRLDPAGRFASRAADYSKHRPDYPAACIDAILEGYSEPTVADVGAGTGISSRMLADRGALVYAVEPNREMRDEGGPHPRVRWVDATAEATTLPGGSVGVVSCFQSFHWFDPERALPEFRRILTERGRVALIWNERDRQHDLTREYSALVSRFATIAPAEERQGVADPIFHTPFFRQPDVLVFTHEQRLGPGGLIGRARSTSYLPSEGPAAEELWNALRALETGCADETGSVRLRYLTRLYRASVK